MEKKERYAISLWNLEGATDKLMNFLEEWMFAAGDITQRAWLVYLCCLLECGKENLAIVGLKHYHSKYGFQYVPDFLPLAWLADKMGSGGSMIKKAAYIFEQFKSEQDNRCFAQYLKNHTFAVVGNAPDIIGTNAGEIIDSRDVVFRMNTFKIRDEYVCDTGCKTNALVSNSNFATLEHGNQTNANQYEWIYIPCDFWHIQISQFASVEKFINTYYELLLTTEVKVTWLFPEDSIELKERLQLISPTSGMAIFYSVYKIFGYVDESWFFGFSKEMRKDQRTENPLKEKSEDNEAIQKVNQDIYCSSYMLSSFFKDTPCYKCSHNMNRELEFRNELFMERTLP